MSEKKLLKRDVKEILRLLTDNDGYISEYSSESELGKQLQTVLEDFQYKLTEKDREIQKLQQQVQHVPVVDLPNSDSVRLHGNMMYTESVIKALDKAGVKYKW